MKPEMVEVVLVPSLAHDETAISDALKQHGIADSKSYTVLKRSIDARRKPVVYRLQCALINKQPTGLPIQNILPQKNVASAREIYIAGSGPCGLFAAVELISRGLKPIILERGKDVRDRRRDLASLNRDGFVNPESNYCFGEGGAGTYSDGKLYTRSKKRGSVEKILNQLVAFGASGDIRIDAHPHIGTNKLPQLIENIRKFILNSGGEVRFNTKLTDIDCTNRLERIQLNGTIWVKCSKLILCTGHSARDIFELLYRRNIALEAKPFALGVRIEHDQGLIDKIQYGMNHRGEYLPAAAYSVVHQAKGKGVYSFCMCPGGIIAPCATKDDEIVTNGWSPSKRNNPYANSGIVVSVDAKLFDPGNTGNPLKALDYQKGVEQKAYALGGGEQKAPAQRLVDFTKEMISKDLPKCSYLPGLTSARLSDCLPSEISFRLKESFLAFGSKMPGYFTNEALLVAPESRTSSPVRIPRTANYQHPQVSGLYPAGEGAGYAGGIVSAAIDGINSAEALVISLKEHA